jgi:hypothetical protein
VQGYAVLGGVAAAQAVGDEAVVLDAAGGLGVVVDTVGVGQEAEAADHAGGAVEGREGLVEPAQGAGGGSAQHDAAPPGAAQDRVEAVGAPGAEHAQHVAAADVDQVLGEQVAGEVLLDAGALVAAEQRDVAGLAGGGEAPVEAHDVVVGVAGGGRQEADAGSGGPEVAGEREDVVVEQRAVALHREASASQCDDLWRCVGHHPSPSAGVQREQPGWRVPEGSAWRYGPASEMDGAGIDSRTHGLYVSAPGGGGPYDVYVAG